MVIYLLIDKIAKIIIDKVPEKDREDFVTGIVFGIAFGIGAGIVLGISAGIAFGIGAGIVLGISAGIGAGIAFGIGAGIGAGIVDFITSSPSLFSVLIIIAILFVLSEMLFIDDKKKPEGQSHFPFTLERKVIAWLESSVILFSLIGLRQSVVKGYPFLKDFLEAYGLSMLDFVGSGTVIIIIIYLYIKVNSLKYKRAK